MKVLFDHQTFSLQQYGGISRYHAELMRGLKSIHGNKIKMSVVLSNNIHLNELCNNIHFFPNANFKGKGSIVYHTNQLYSEYMLKYSEYDIFHPTYYDTYFLKYLSKPFVVTYHDMIYERFHNKYKELYIDKKIIDRKRRIAERADKIIAVSENTKSDIIDILNVDPDKVEVVYHGYSMSRRVIDSIGPKIPFLLFVGNRSMYKNFRFFLESISTILKGKNIELICGGGGEFDKEEKTLINALKVSHLVKQVSVDDFKLKQLYSKAIAFVFPSRYEGFGIPILEAFSCGCPCILSDKSCLPEIGGNAAAYFDPNSRDSIVETVGKVLDSDEIKHRLAESGYERLKLFSWENAVEQTFNLYNKLI